MKMIQAVLRQTTLDAVQEALHQAGISGMTVSEVRGYGRQKGEREQYRGTEFTADSVPRIKLEVAVPDESADEVIEAILARVQTGKIGDGKIFVFDQERAIRIRTLEEGSDIL